VYGILSSHFFLIWNNYQNIFSWSNPLLSIFFLLICLFACFNPVYIPLIVLFILLWHLCINYVKLYFQRVVAEPADWQDRKAIRADHVRLFVNNLLGNDEDIMPDMKQFLFGLQKKLDRCASRLEEFVGLFSWNDPYMSSLLVVLTVGSIIISFLLPTEFLFILVILAFCWHFTPFVALRFIVYRTLSYYRRKAQEKQPDIL